MTPRLRFAHLPTPVEPMPRLAKALGLSHLYVKRDDLTGLAFGGNKTRKLEFLLAEAQAQGADTLITAGAVQSNHCRQTAAAAAKFGFDCLLVLTGEPPDRPSANLLLDELLGARIVWAGGRENRERVLTETFEQAKAEGKRPYLIPYGGSSPTGALSYVFAMGELIRQKPFDGELPDWIVFASSSGGTQAGLTLGAHIFGYRGCLLGISVDEPSEVLQERIAALATETSLKLEKRIEFSPFNIWVNDDYCKAGYGVLTEAEREAILLFARLEGLLLDPVYTGRAAAGLIDLVRKGFLDPDERILFWHTGGQPALFAEAYRL
ncbi:MAG: D-cysteine desulfhydrase family protein [Anaerolineales bacterium]|nr:D-cysteine desulfhydrase family protein [Anaerolineales bacterium]MCX7607766.1 D-cysteine desulfhydrase family protein [Anaerolineales bacterium]MDW8227711.1 D-cysteine desulfhydrase family protein [Anaerolineales bacterium]